MTFLAALEYMAVAVGSISGVLAAAGRRVDLFGVLVLALVTAFGGGTLRDLLLGNLPPAWMRRPDWLYTAALAAVATFFAARQWRFPDLTLQIADAIGLALFTIAGTRQGLLGQVDPSVAIVLGVITGVAGGMLRDTLLRQVPLVFQREIHLYATAAFAGAAIYVAVPRRWLPEDAVFLLGVLVTLALRLAAMRWRLALPYFEARDQRPPR